jgi:hypothetical protein
MVSISIAARQINANRYGPDRSGHLGRLRYKYHVGGTPSLDALVDVNYLDRSATTIVAGGSGE